MRVLFDTSALVAAMVSTLPHHRSALACYQQVGAKKVSGTFFTPVSPGE